MTGRHRVFSAVPWRPGLELWLWQQWWEVIAPTLAPSVAPQVQTQRWLSVGEIVQSMIGSPGLPVDFPRAATCFGLPCFSLGNCDLSFAIWDSEWFLKKPRICSAARWSHNGRWLNPGDGRLTPYILPHWWSSSWLWILGIVSQVFKCVTNQMDFWMTSKWRRQKNWYFLGIFPY